MQTGGITRIQLTYGVDLRNLLPFAGERTENIASEPYMRSLERISAHSRRGLARPRPRGLEMPVAPLNEDFLGLGRDVGLARQTFNRIRFGHGIRTIFPRVWPSSLRRWASAARASGKRSETSTSNLP